MNTQLILFRQQLLLNPKFAKINDYGWSYTGTWTKSDGLITSSGAGTLYQEQLLIIGAPYRLRYTISGTPGGNVVFSDGVTNHHTGSATGSYIVDFVAAGMDVIFTAGAAFNASISNVSIVATPESFNIDLDEDVSIPMNFNIDNIFDISKRKTPFSKTIKIPGTHNNNHAFNHIYKINSQSLFNPNLKSPVLIKNKGLTLFKGVLCLDDVTKKIIDGSEIVEYSTSVTGEIVSVYDALGNKTIRDLDFSDYDHDYTIENIIDSWEDSIFINGVAGQSNRINTYTSPAVIAEAGVVYDGKNRIEIQFAAPHSFAVGDEVYVEVGPGQIALPWSYDQLVINVPATDKIILDAYNPSVTYSGTGTSVVTKEMLAGFGYWYPCVNNGTWMTNHFANGYNGGTGLLTVGEEYIINTYNTGDDFSNVGASSNSDGEIFTATGTSQTSGQLVIGQSYVIDTYNTGDDFSNLGVDNVSGAEFTALQIDQDGGDLIVGQDYEIIARKGSDDFVSVGASSNTTGVQFTATGTTLSNGWVHKSIVRPINFLLPQVWSNGSTLEATTMYPTTWTSPTILTTFRDTDVEGTLIDKGNSSLYATDNYWECYDFVPHIFLREVLLKIFSLLGYEYECEFFDSKIFRRLILPCEQTYCNTGLVEGGSIVMNNITPKIKLSDILTTVVNMFNLAVIPNEDDNLTLKFVNRGDFFSNTPVDWTDKLDTSQPLVLQMMNRSFPKSYTFKYKDSQDVYNTDYNEDFGSVVNGAALPNAIDRKYGDAYIDLRSDYLTAQNQVQLIFEPSVMSDDTERTTMLYTTTYNSGVVRAISNRLLIAGKRWLTSSFFHVVSKLDPSMNLMTKNYYPYAGHIDNHMSPYPKWDINFSKPLGVYFTGSTTLIPSIVTDDSWDEGGLYNVYWSKYIDSIANPNSKIVTGYFKLSVMDIYKLDFQTPIIVQDYKLRLNKIIDWDVNGNGICKCEFLYSGA